MRRVNLIGRGMHLGNWAIASRPKSKPSSSPTPPGRAAPVVRAMENLKLAMRLRRGSLDQAGGDAIAVALDAAAQTVEHS